MQHLAGMGGHRQRNFSLAQPEAIHRAGFEQGQSLNGFDRRARKDGRIGIPAGKHLFAVTIHHQHRTAMAAFHHLTAHDLNKNRMCHP